MNQNTAIVGLAVGVVAFLAGFGAELGATKEWAELASPTSVGRILVMLSGVGGSIAAALQIQLPAKR